MLLYTRSFFFISSNESEVMPQDLRLFILEFGFHVALLFGYRDTATYDTSMLAAVVRFCSF